MRICYLLLFLLPVSTVFGQYHKPDTTKYRLNLPSYWKRGDKVWMILTDALPKVCPELEQKEMCTDCKALYTIDLYTSVPEVVSKTTSLRPGYTNQYNETIFYRFTAALYMKDTSGTVLVDMLLVDTSELFSVVTTSQRNYQQNIPTKSLDGRPLAKLNAAELSYTMEPLPGTTQLSDPLVNKNDQLAIKSTDLYRIINSRFHALKE